jgi:pimeloyl-ACP methyl ester carboxylesterase
MTKTLGLLVAALTALGPIGATARAAPSAAPASVCASPSQALDEQGFVTIGGIAQWVTVKGQRCDNPVVLIVHGGPGNPLSLYGDAIYGGWTRDYTIVQWDQRGSGMTYGRSPPVEGEALTLDQMTADGVEVAQYAARHLGARKVIVMGSSWGSILATRMVQARPDLFYAYVGTSQVVGYQQNQSVTYPRLLGLARAAGDQDSVAKLEALGPPPWTNPRAFGIQRRILRKYEAMKTDPFPKDWWKTSGVYATPKYEADYEAGEDYSFVQFVGLHGDGMFSGVDFTKRARFEIPVFLMQGAEDLLTSPDVTQAWYDSLKAPSKALVLVPRVGHDPNGAMIDAQFKVLQDQVRPLVKP